MYTFAVISKNTYPYQTIHVAACGAVSRSRRVSYPSLEQVGRLDLIRSDKCGKCMPYAEHGTPHPALMEVYRIQREYKHAQANSARLVRLTEQKVALELALAKVNEDLTLHIGSDGGRTIRHGELLTEYRRTMADGTFTPDALDVTVGRAKVTERPARNW